MSKKAPAKASEKPKRPGSKPARLPTPNAGGNYVRDADGNPVPATDAKSNPKK